MLANKMRFDNLFNIEYFDTFLKIYGLSTTNTYQELPYKLAAYQRKLKKLRLNSLFTFSSGETYVERIEIDCNNYYHAAWNIGAAKNITQKYKLPVKYLALGKIIKSVDQSCINKNRLDFSLTNNNPILIADYPPAANRPDYIIIDGNHRVTSKFRAGQKEIKGILMSPENHMQAMLGEFHRVLYKIHFNMYLIASYTGGKLIISDLEKQLYEI